MDEILIFIFNSNLIRNSAKKITGGDDLYNDLISELILIISDKDIEFLNGLKERGELEIYCYKIMYYQYTQPHMAFYKKYRNLESGEIPESIEPFDIDLKHEEVLNIINKIEKQISKTRYPTELRILEIYAEKGSYRKVADQVGISFKTAQYLTKQITEKIRKEYDLTYNG